MIWMNRGGSSCEVLAAEVLCSHVALRVAVALDDVPGDLDEVGVVVDGQPVVVDLLGSHARDACVG